MADCCYCSTGSAGRNCLLRLMLLLLLSYQTKHTQPHTATQNRNYFLCVVLCGLAWLGLPLIDCLTAKLADGAAGDAACQS